MARISRLVRGAGDPEACPRAGRSLGNQDGRLLTADARTRGADEWNHYAGEAGGIEARCHDIGLKPSLGRHAVRAHSLPKRIAGYSVSTDAYGGPSLGRLQLGRAFKNIGLRVSSGVGLRVGAVGSLDQLASRIGGLGSEGGQGCKTKHRCTHSQNLKHIPHLPR
jgi:hypothetical protein